MKSRKSNILVNKGLVIILLLLQSCIQENFEYKLSDTNHGIWEVSVWGFIEDRDDFTTLKQAIEISGLKDLFDRDGDWTYVLPNNKAFRDFMPFNGYRNVSEIPVPILRNLLRYLVVKDRVIFTDPDLFESNNPIPYETVNGQIMYLSHQTSFVGIVNEGTAKSFEIYTSNLQTTSGVVHVVGSMVYYSLPPGNMQIDTTGPGTPLTLVRNLPVKVSEGSIPIDGSVLEIGGASPENIIHTLEKAPDRGWLVMNGTRFLRVGDRFTQSDIELLNMIYISDGSGDDVITLSTTSKSGFELEAFDIKIEMD